MPKVKRLTFGVELEFSKKSAQCDEIARARGFASRVDRSVRADPSGVGFEMVTPVLTAKLSDASTMRDEIGSVPRISSCAPTVIQFDESIIEALCNTSLLVNETCGVHVHLGRPRGATKKSLWSPEQCRAFILSGIAIEDKLYAACPPSRRACEHAKPIMDVYRPEDFGHLNTHPAEPAHALKYNNPKRYCWLNIVETVRPGTETVPFEEQVRRGTAVGLGTVEIRMLGNTRRVDYILAWVRMCLRWAEYIANYDPATAIAGISLGGWLDNEIQAVTRSKARAVTQTATGPAATTRDLLAARGLEAREHRAQQEARREQAAEERPPVSGTNWQRDSAPASERADSAPIRNARSIRERARELARELPQRPAIDSIAGEAGEAGAGEAAPEYRHDNDDSAF